jgi:septum site-determining protein MinC
MGLEIALAGRNLAEAFEELEARLAERPGFYRGTSATANFGAAPPDDAEVERLRALLEEAGIELSSITQGEAAPPEAELERRRALRPAREVQLSDSARSLVADFAGARTDIAERRKRGESSVRRLPERTVPVEEPSPVLRVVEAAPETLYHVGTLRGGQALHHIGNIVVVGDVNPGAELVATGDVVVFGRLAGVAHAGAQGENTARVFALDLDATQLRIATFIAADSGTKRTPRPEAALVRDGRIAVVPFDQLDALGVIGS